MGQFIDASKKTDSFKIYEKQREIAEVRNLKDTTLKEALKYKCRRMAETNEVIIVKAKTNKETKEEKRNKKLQVRKTART